MTVPRDTISGIVAEITENLARLIEEVDRPTLTSARRRALESQIKSMLSTLETFLNELDPIRQPTSVFDPSNPKIVGRFIALALVAQPKQPLSTVPRFYGSGVYAIYYRGSYDLYRDIAGSETPIYVGQAAPRLNNALTPTMQGDQLSKRLNEHRKNIVRANSTLDIEDFEFRSLVIQSGWETSAEDYLIHLFNPIWNSETKILYGLGKHGDDAGTRANKRSPWDTLHPGRIWAAASLEDAKTPETIAAEVRSHFTSHPVFKSLDAVLASFIEELRQV